MKYASVLKALCYLSISTALSAPGQFATREPTIIERGQNHRVWQSVMETETATGRLIRRTNSYTELATGLHYIRDGQLVESKEEIELFQGGAVALQGQHQVIFDANLNTVGAIDLFASDGKRFRSRILGLVLFDAATGQSMLIAQVKDCIGELAGNVVLYPDAFAEVKCDVR